MIIENLEKMSEEELGAIMGFILTALGLVLKYANPLMAGRVLKLAAAEGKKAKQLTELTDKADKIDKGIEMAADIFAFRQKHPQDFEKVLNLAQDFVANYYSDPKTKEQLLKMFK